jgi:hypothetical protein
VESIACVIGDDPRWRVTLIIVDDDSDDDTWNVIRVASENYLNLNIQGLRLTGHPGKAVAQALGVREASARSIVVFMDGDGQHSPTDLPRMLEQCFVSGMPCVGRRKEYKRRLISRIGVGALKLVGRPLGVDFDPRESEFLALPASAADAVRKDSQLGVVPILAVVRSRIEVAHFEFDVRPRLSDAQSSRWHIGELWRKGLLQLLSDPWKTLPRIAASCVAVMFGMLFYGLWVGLQALRSGNFLGIGSIIVLLTAIFAYLSILNLMTLGLVVTRFQARAISSSDAWITEKLNNQSGGASDSQPK